MYLIIEAWFDEDLVPYPAPAATASFVSWIQDEL